MTHSWTRRAGLAVAGIVVSITLILLAHDGGIFADVPWPTPPPGPEAKLPNVIDPANVKQVDIPRVEFAISWLISPLAMPVPRFPPVPKSEVQSKDGLLLVIDAGSIDSTVQVVYEPLPLDKAPSSARHQEMLKAFDLQAFDHRAKRITLNLQRPWVLELPIRTPYGDPSRLVIARYTADHGWLPLVTSYHQSRGILEARVLSLGRFAILSEPRIVSG